MTTQANKQLALDHFNRVNNGDIAGAAALVAEDCIDHSAVPEAQGRKGFEMLIGKVRTACPDMAYAIEDVLAETDRVVVRVTCTGTQTGPMTFRNLQKPPSGRTVKFEQTHTVRIADGQIVERWMTQDSLALFRQLGVRIVPE